jgi:hypothetical protein
MPGAIGLWLWALPWANRSGAISAWSSEEDLRGFVQLPLHIGVMRRYRERGALSSTTWAAGKLLPDEVIERACEWIAAR